MEDAAITFVPQGDMLGPFAALTTPPSHLAGNDNCTLLLSDNGTTTAPPPPASGPTMLFRFICEFCIVAPIAVLGVVGNILAIIVLYRQKQRQGTILFLQVLALADTTVLITSLILRSFRYLYAYTRWMWLAPYNSVYHYIFRWLFPFVYFFRLVDTWLVVLLTVDRYIAVRHPLHAQRLCTYLRAVKHLIILLIISLLFSLPRFFEYRINLDNKIFGFEATELFRNKAYNIGYRMVIFFLLQYLVPMIVLIILNTKLLRTLRTAEQYRAQIAEGHGSRTRSVTATVVTVVLVAILCNVTALITHLLWSLHEGFPQLVHLELARRYMALISNIFVTLNSAVNFGIYCLCSRNFRTVLCRLCGCYSGRRPLKRTQSSMRTTGTYISLAHSSTIRKKSNSVNLNNTYLPNKLYG